mgnify:CR=1 FL=1
MKNSFFNFFLLLTLIFLFKISLLNFDSLNRNTTTVSIENSKFSSAPLSKPLITDIEIEVENDQEEKESSPSDEFSKENKVKQLNNYFLAHFTENIFSTQFSLAPTPDRKSTRLNSSHIPLSRMPSSA